MRDQFAGFAWVYLVDVLLTPIGLLAAVASRHGAWAVVAALPLALLLAVFARERHGRIENARELHRMAKESEARLQSIVQNSSDLITVVEPNGVIRTRLGPLRRRPAPRARRPWGGSCRNGRMPRMLPC